MGGTVLSRRRGATNPEASVTPARISARPPTLQRSVTRPGGHADEEAKQEGVVHEHRPRGAVLSAELIHDQLSEARPALCGAVATSATAHAVAINTFRKDTLFRGLT